LPKYRAAQTDFSEAMEINLHPDNIHREEGFKLNRAWNPMTRLLSQSDAYIYQTKLTTNTGKSMPKRTQKDTRLSDIVIG
jgi:hypothetical protein